MKKFLGLICVLMLSVCMYSTPVVAHTFSATTSPIELKAYGGPRGSKGGKSSGKKSGSHKGGGKSGGGHRGGKGKC